MTVDRRSILAASLGLGAATTVAQAAPPKTQRDAPQLFAHDIAPGLKPNADGDQTALLQSAIDAAAAKDAPLALAPGVYRISDLRVRANTRLIGAAGTTVLMFTGGKAFITGDKADGLLLQDIVFDGAFNTLDPARADALITLTQSQRVVLDGVTVRNSAAGLISLTGCSGRIVHATLTDALDFALKSLDANDMDIAGNVVASCANNGILVWRSAKGDDGTTVTGNRISKIRNALGGTGEYGNGVNVYRAGGVLVANNRISDCSYSAVRGNAADDIQIIANSCERLGEVALYAEFGFEGALIANNVVNGAATGISVTNFNEGGRLAVIQGNLIRNLVRREHERDDKRGEGIGVEADAAVTGNTIEGAPSVGIQIGWGKFMRDVAVTGNVIRRAKVGISITSAAEAGACLIANNLISQTGDGAIRRMTLGVMVGPDLARDGATGQVTVTGNVSV